MSGPIIFSIALLLLPVAAILYDDWRETRERERINAEFDARLEQEQRDITARGLDDAR